MCHKRRHLTISPVSRTKMTEPKVFGLHTDCAQQQTSGNEAPHKQNDSLRRDLLDKSCHLDVGATTSGGLLSAKPLEEGSIESTLAGVGLPLFLLDVRRARHGQTSPPKA